MLNDPLRRLFAHDLTDERFDLLFTFLSQLTDLCFEAYEHQIVRMAADPHTLTTQSGQPLDLDYPQLDDEIPF